MRYEYYDLERNLLGERENPEGEAKKRDEVLTLRLDGLTANRWRVIAVADPVDGMQKVAIRPI